MGQTGTPHGVPLSGNGMSPATGGLWDLGCCCLFQPRPGGNLRGSAPKLSTDSRPGTPVVNARLHLTPNPRQQDGTASSPCRPSGWPISSSGYLQVIFTSDISVVSSGFTADWTIDAQGCIACSAGKYKSSAGSASGCTSCPAGSTVLSGATACSQVIALMCFCARSPSLALSPSLPPSLSLSRARTHTHMNETPQPLYNSNTAAQTLQELGQSHVLSMQADLLVTTDCLRSQRHPFVSKGLVIVVVLVALRIRAARRVSSCQWMILTCVLHE